MPAHTVDQLAAEELSTDGQLQDFHVRRAVPFVPVSSLYVGKTPIGSGGFATILKACQLGGKQQGQMALKLFDPAANNNTEIGMQLFLQELQLLAQLDHGSIARIFGWGEWKGKTYRQLKRNSRPNGLRNSVFYLQEYMVGGSLFQLLCKQAERPLAKVYSWSDAIRWARQIASALSYLHEQGIVHRDVTMGNIMLTDKCVAAADAKLIDFGLATSPQSRAMPMARAATTAPHLLQGATTHTLLSKECNDGSESDSSLVLAAAVPSASRWTEIHDFRGRGPEEALDTQRGTAAARSGLPADAKWATQGMAPVTDPQLADTGCVGSYMYMAPEIFLGTSHGCAADVYSLGCVLYELFSRSLRVLYLGGSNRSVTFAYAARAAAGDRPQMLDSFPQEVRELIVSMWAHDWRERPSAVQVERKLAELTETPLLAPRTSRSLLGRFIVTRRSGVEEGT